MRSQFSNNKFEFTCKWLTSLTIAAITSLNRCIIPCLYFAIITKLRRYICRRPIYTNSYMTIYRSQSDLRLIFDSWLLPKCCQPTRFFNRYGFQISIVSRMIKYLANVVVHVVLILVLLCQDLFFYYFIH